MSLIIPKPYHEETFKGQFVFSESDTIKGIDSFPRALTQLTNYLKLRVSETGRVSFEKDTSLSEEEYILRVDENNINIIASTDHGAYYGALSLEQILPPVCYSLGIGRGMYIPSMLIHDKPEFKYRGFMMDVARHFFPKEEVKRMIELISLYKFNYLHFHISDDQGFRLDIPKYPKLKEISSHREESEIDGVFRKSSIVMDHKEEGGYYTQEDIDDILKCASDHFIKVIPEVDVPGHFTAVLAAYPEYLCKPHDLKVRTTWGISKDTLCIGNPYSLLFVNDLMVEVLKMFHTNEIHIGGDECPIDSYKKCPKCQALMMREGIKDVKDLQGYFTDRLSFLLTQEGYKVRVWNEAISPNLDRNIVVQYWMAFKHPEKVFDAIKKGTKVIASPFMKYYLDYTYTLFTMKETYEFNPYYDELKGEHKENIIGVETPIWTEWIADRKRLDFQVFPRLLAVSESGWTAPENKNYNDFLYRLKSNLLHLKTRGVFFAPEECYMQEKIKMSKFTMLRYYLFAKKNAINEEYRKWTQKEKQNGSIK